jgi:hypothetical protein
MDSIARNEIRCVVEQIRVERETRKTLSDSYMSESRKEQIIENRKGQVRRRYGCSMDDSLKV